MRIETQDVDPDTTAPSKLEGVMLRRKVHKTGHKGEAVVFLSLVGETSYQVFIQFQE